MSGSPSIPLGQLTRVDCDTQDQSPLFSKIPNEVRNSIFEFALTEYEDTSHPYRRDSHYYRPGHTSKRRLDTELLRTCRLIYLETRNIPLSEFEFTYWFEKRDRCPPGAQGLQELDRISMVPEDKRHLITHVHVFAQLFWVEDYFGMSSRLHPFGRVITLTIRHTDFWHWENDQPLALRNEWVEAYKLPKSVDKFIMEFETQERRRKQLDTLVNRVKRDWIFVRQDGVRVSARDATPVVSRWIGSASFDGKNIEPGRPENLTYYVLKLTWTPQQSARSDGDL